MTEGSPTGADTVPGAPGEAASETPTVAGGSALLFSAQIVGNAGFFVAVLVLARGLTIAGRGTIAFITVTAVVAARIALVGLGDATTVFAAQRPSQRGALLSNLLLFTVVSALVGAGIVCSFLLLVPGLRPPGVGHVELAILAVGTIAAALIDAGYSFLLGIGRLRQQAMVTASAPWVYALLLTGAWVASGLTVARAAVVWTTAHSIWAALLVGGSVRRIGLGRPDLRLLRESIGFGVRVWLGALSRFLNFRVDQILMGLIATEAALGIYATAVNLSEVLLYLPGAVAAAIIPVIARAHPERQVEQTLRTFRSLIVVTAPAIAAAALLGPVILPLAFGGAYRSSVGPFLWLLPGALGYAASGVFSSALLTSAAPTLSSLGPFVSLVVGFALDVALIPPLGATGAAIAASVAFLVGGASALAAYRARSGFPWRELVPRPSDAAILRDLAASSLLRIRRR